MDIKGAIAIVTGGGSGLGEATARGLAAAGAKVALLDMNLEAAQAVAAEIGGLAVHCNVADAASAEAAMENVKSKLGAPRLLVNCAGILGGKRILGKEGVCELSAFEKVISVNLNGTFNMLRLAAAQMAELEPIGADGERGVIINTASIAAYEGQIGQAAYAASKGGIVSMTLPAAREFARVGIRVMAIAPGPVATPMITALSDEIQESLIRSVPYPHRLAKPEEFTKLVLHIMDNA
ncbi:MAG: SDR family NAD(P)-dependent oxidoreductase, partial [Rickettsiales bacterium]